jgi:phosphate/sulfate permease
MAIFGNPWFIAIVGGILSGLLTTFITRWIFSRRENREYLQKLATANREVIYAIRPGIPEGALPSTDVIKAMISSTARKYGVEIKDMLNPKAVIEDLMKEVMDSNFISSKSKTEYCAQLSQLMEDMEPPKREDLSRPIPTTALSDYRQRSISLVTTMMGIFAALMTFTVALSSSKSFGSVLLPTIIAMIGVILTAYISILYRYYERKKEKKEQEGKDKSDNKVGTINSEEHSK